MIPFPGTQTCPGVMEYWRNGVVEIKTITPTLGYSLAQT